MSSKNIFAMTSQVRRLASTHTHKHREREKLGKGKGERECLIKDRSLCHFTHVIKFVEGGLAKETAVY